MRAAFYCKHMLQEISEVDSKRDTVTPLVGLILSDERSRRAAVVRCHTCVKDARVSRK